MTSRQVLVLGNLRGTAKAALEVARRDTHFEATQVSRTDEAVIQLDAQPWSAVLVDLTTPGASRFCHEARARRALFNVPLIAMSPKLTDLAFSNAFRWGADDVVLLGAIETLAARLRGLPAQPVPETRASRGEAIIADPDRGRCDVLGRVLANAGFNVRYALDVVSTRFYLSKPGVELFVLNSELAEPLSLVKEARAAGSKAQWVLTTKQRHVAKLRTALRDTTDTIVMSSHGPPENVLFALNLLRPSGGASQRAELRALHGAVVLFRSVGEDHDEHGFTYSVSATGLYVRTLVPPPADKLWIEIQPPNMHRRVRLVGRVAWTRHFGESGAETAPPGFGVQIVDGLGADLDLWLDGFNSLEIREREPHEVPELKTSSGSFRIPLPSNPPPVKSSPALPAASLRSASRELAAAHKSAPHELSKPAVQGPPSKTANPSPSQRAIADALLETLAAKGLTTIPPTAARQNPVEGLTTSVRGQTADEGEATTKGTVSAPQKVWDSSHSDRAAYEVDDAPKATTRNAADALGGSGPAASADPPRLPSQRARTVLGLGAFSPPPAARPHEQVEEAAAERSEPASVAAKSAVDAAAPTIPSSQARPPAPPPRKSPTGTLLAHPAPAQQQVPIQQPSLEDELTEGDLLSFPPQQPVFPVKPLVAGAPKSHADSALANSPTTVRDAPAAGPKAPAPVRNKRRVVGAGLLFLASSAALIYVSFKSAPADPANTPAGAETQATPAAVAPAQSSIPSIPAAPPQASALAEQKPSETRAKAEPVTSAASPSETAEVPELPSLPAHSLPEDSTYILVRSAAHAKVFVHGIETGETNHWLLTKCGTRFIRLGTAPGQWVSEGMPRKLRCRSQNIVDLPPSEP